MFKRTKILIEKVEALEKERSDYFAPKIEALEKDIFVLHTKHEATEKIVKSLTTQLNAIYLKSVPPQTILRPLRAEDE